MTHEEARRLLGVGAGAGRHEIRQAYRELIKVWHPDRFQSDAGLRPRAEAAVRQLNEAYAVLQGLRPQTGGPAVSPPPPHVFVFSRLAARLDGRWVVSAVTVGILVAASVTWWGLRERSADAPMPPGESRGDVVLPSAPARSGAVVSSAERAREARAAATDDPLRPASGTELISPEQSGRSSLIVYNTSAHDAAVVLSQGGAHAHAVYVRAGEQLQVLNVAAGTYRILATTGYQWRATRYTADAAYLEFERTVEFHEQDGDAGVDFTRMTLFVGAAGDGSGFRRGSPFLVGD